MKVGQIIGVGPSKTELWVVARVLKVEGDVAGCHVINGAWSLDISIASQAAVSDEYRFGGKVLYVGDDPGCRDHNDYLDHVRKELAR